MNTLRGHKYAILLAALLCVTVLKSLSQRLQHPVFAGLSMIAAMLLVFLIVFERRTDRRVASVVLIIAAAAFAAPYLLGSHPQPFHVIDHSAALLLSGFATFVILRNISAQRVVGGDDVLGAVCGYLLAAEAWSDVYLLIESFSPGSFSVSPGFGASLETWYGRVVVLSNVSLGSLTSLGSSAAVAVQPPATILVPLESLFGQFYIAVVVAQLVGARLTERQSGDSRND